MIIRGGSKWLRLAYLSNFEKYVGLLLGYILLYYSSSLNNITSLTWIATISGKYIWCE